MKSPSEQTSPSSSFVSVESHPPFSVGFNRVSRRWSVANLTNQPPPPTPAHFPTLFIASTYASFLSTTTTTNHHTAQTRKRHSLYIKIRSHCMTPALFWSLLKNKLLSSLTSSAAPATGASSLDFNATQANNLDEFGSRGEIGAAQAYLF